jgi:hypothetical protein
MNNVATTSRTGRADLFAATAERMQLHSVNIEKDFWVCWLLKQLLTIRELNGWLTFKGGTSLSKCFNLIRRFSEEIDLAVDFERLGFTGHKDPRRDDHQRVAFAQRQVAGPAQHVVVIYCDIIQSIYSWICDVKKYGIFSNLNGVPATVLVCCEYNGPA